MKKLYVNLGCGQNIMESTKDIEWLNVDNYLITDAKNFKQGDVRELSFEKESIDYIICDQVLEHIPMYDIPVVLYEIRRVLKKGGKAIIVVPDFRDAVQGWLSYDWEKCFQPELYQWYSEVIYGNQNHEGEYHRSPMSAGYLNYILNMVGLKKHQLILHAKNSPVPQYPGINYPPKTILRNAQIVAEITK